MVTDGSFTCGEHSIMYREVESLHFTPETKVTWCIRYSSKRKLKKKIPIEVRTLGSFPPFLDPHKNPFLFATNTFVNTNAIEGLMRPSKEEQ